VSNFADDEQARPGESERDRAFRVGAARFDREHFEQFGRYPEESPLYGTTPQQDDPRRAAIQALIDRGATEGERAAARAAMHRLDAEPDAERLARDLQDEADFEEAAAFGEA
jgi:hypothetical protein